MSSTGGPGTGLAARTISLVRYGTFSVVFSMKTGPLLSFSSGEMKPMGDTLNSWQMFYNNFLPNGTCRHDVSRETQPKPTG
jgi:hypothetical protein